MEKKTASITTGITVDEELVRKVAHLARLDLSPEETRTFAGQLGGILRYFDEIQSVDVTGIAPMTHPLELSTPLREDEVRPSPKNSEGHPKVLDAAPQVMDGGYKVPPIL